MVPRGRGDVPAMGRARIRPTPIRHGHVPNERQGALSADKGGFGREVSRRWRRVAQRAVDAGQRL